MQAESRRTVHRSPLLWFGAALATAAGFALLGPAERSLGTNVRVVYLHGAWVWSALAGFLAAALLGLWGLVAHQSKWQRWSRSLGRTGLFFWITYLPISMWAMQTNWNGLFLVEPRWRLALVFAVAGVLLQAGVSLMDDPAWAAAGNAVYFLTLILALSRTQDVMHPSAPIMNSESWRIQFFFAGLLVLTMLSGSQFARWLYQFERSGD